MVVQVGCEVSGLPVLRAYACGASCLTFSQAEKVENHRAADRSINYFYMSMFSKLSKYMFVYVLF